MGNFHSNSRGGFGGGRSGGFGGGRGGGRGGFGGGGYGRDRGERRPLEMHSVTCDKCHKQCEVPFKPTGDKPVYCSDCFKQNDGGRNGGAGMTSEQFEQLNAKLDKILLVLQQLEIDTGDEDEDEDEFDEDSEDEDEKDL